MIHPTAWARDDLAATVWRYYSVVDNQDIDALLDLFTPDAVYHRPGYEAIRGRDGLDRFYKKERVIETGRHTVEAMVVKGRSVAVRGQFVGTSRTGEPLDLCFADFFEGDQLIRSRWTYFYVPLV